MAAKTYPYNPDYAIAPGDVLAEHLEARAMSQAEFARRAGRSAKLISEIVAGKAPIEPATALQFERVLGVDASIWLGMDGTYRIHRAREAEAEAAKNESDWTRQFPLEDLVRRGHVPALRTDSEGFSRLLEFFGVGSIDAWKARCEQNAAAYRHSPSFESDEAALMTWLRLGELEAERQDCGAFDATAFRRALRSIRALTKRPVESGLETAQALINSTGVALAVIRPFKGMAVSGASWWLSPSKAVIQLSARHKSDDHLWFSLFHEAAHLVLHKKKMIYISAKSNDPSLPEREADEWAANMLISRSAWAKFAAAQSFSLSNVNTFAREQGIAPGIVVGRLQHENRIRYSQLNQLKVRLTWEEEA